MNLSMSASAPVKRDAEGPVDAPDAPAGRPRRRAAAALLAVVLVLVATALVVGPPRPGERYDPANVGPDGLAGLMELLESVEVDVEVSREVPSDMSTRLFIATDRLGGDARSEVAAWVEAGGTLVVAGGSPLHGLGLTAGSVSDMFGATPRAPDCELLGLADVGTVEHAGWAGFAVPDDHPDHTRCFEAGSSEPWMVVTPQDAGQVVALGSATPFLNANLDRADNAILAAAVLAPQPGDRLVVVPPGAVGEGDTAVVDLVPGGFWRLLALGVAAAIAAIVWRARRLGPPVDERLPPVLPSAELARSVAALLQRSGDRSTAVQRLRDDARRDVLHALGLPAATADEQLVNLAVARTGVAPDAAEVALVHRPVGDDAGLLEVARACAAVRDHVRHPKVSDPHRADIAP